MINGIERPLKAYKSLVGFVPQEDIMIRNLTVEENLRFCAFSRLPSSWSDEKKVLIASLSRPVVLSDGRHNRRGAHPS